MGHLVLSRRPGEKLVVGNAVITFAHMTSNRATVMIEAPAEVKILRAELDEFRDNEPTDLIEENQ